MTTIISGTLRDALGNPINGALTLRAKRTTSNVFQDTYIRVETVNGKYSLNLQPCEYDVVLAVDGYNKNQLGTIQILADTPNGSLNDLLINPKTGEQVTPEILQQMIEYRDQTKHYAETVDLSTVVKIGDGGLLSTTKTVPDPLSTDLYTGFYRYNRESINTPVSATMGYVMKISWNNSDSVIMAFSYNSDRAYFGFRDKSTGVIQYQEFITTANSTVDSNGFYKKSSPIVRLFGSENINPAEGFTQSGCGLVNHLATGVTVKRVDVGHYEIHGSLGFAREGWYITLPEDANGNKKFFAEYSFNDGVITVKTYTRKFSTKLCEIVAGDPIDITDGRWIDLRLEMPEVIASELDSSTPNDNNA